MSDSLPASTSAPGCDARARFLTAQPWFALLTPELRESVPARCTTLLARRGETVLAAGDEVHGWYAVLQGVVKLQTWSRQGRRQSFLGVPEGEWFGEGSVMKGERRRYDVVALRDTELLCLPREVFLALHATSLPFVQHLSAHLNMRLGQAMAVIEAMRLRSAEQVLALYLGPTLWQGAHRVSLGQEELGVLAGLSRQTVNRVLKQFERQGLVSLSHGRVSITDEAGLQSLLLD